MFLLAFCIHLIFLFSIFDIYFKSPIVKNVTPYQSIHDKLADRLVLFVVDGLRAESFVNHTTMTYMRSKASTEGRWGISHTRVPTESRPGHVAVIAGFYEDPSAVAKGWKENPVDFDSVLNQTKYTWSWGTYDIVDIFTKGTLDNHIFVSKFDPYDQSFSTDKNTTLLDSWVFDNVRAFFSKAKNDKDLKEKLSQDKIVLFLHLLGTDTSGHTHKPKTKNFLTTLRFVDEGIREMEKLIRDYYNNDGKTTFLMTSDHGMTDWGSHGAGDDHETQTPYVLWGAGVSQVEVQETKDLPSWNKLDIDQADLTPLMSTVLSIPVPVNSIGKLPADLLNMSLQNRAKATYSNARQLASQYNKKRQDVESNAISLLYVPYEPLDERKYKEIITFTETLLEEGKHEKLIILSEEIMHLSLQGLNYYHNYYQRPLLFLVTLAFIGWIVCLLKVILQQSLRVQTDTTKIGHLNTNNMKSFTNLGFLVLGIFNIYLVYGQNLPVQYHLYFLLPVALWWHAFSTPQLWMHSFGFVKRKRKLPGLSLKFICYTLGCISMGLSFSYRWMLSIPLLGMALWPFLSSVRKQLNKTILFSWSFSCTLLSTFTFMPVVGKQVFIELVILAGILWIIGYSLYIQKCLVPLKKRGLETKEQIVLSVVQIVILVISLHNIYVQSERFEMGTPVSYLHQSVASIVAAITLIYPLLHSKRLICRTMAINTSILTFYLLLSVSHEGLFLVTLMFNTLIWVIIEFRLVHSSKVKLGDYTFGVDNGEKFLKIERGISHQDFRRAFFFLLYIITAFFGTGNIASLNSFEVRWVTCFITSFHPFIITGLILLKTLAPFLSVACAYRAVQLISKAPIGYLNILVLIYSNIMGIQLLYYVKNTGSWLEIGTSISQYVIVQVITLFIVLIHQLARGLTEIHAKGLVNLLSKSMFKGAKKNI